MSRFLKGFGLVFLLFVAYYLTNSLISSMQVLSELYSPLTAWVQGGMGLALSVTLCYFYWSLYTKADIRFGNLKGLWSKGWVVFLAYVLYLVCQILFPMGESNNQQNVIDFVQHYPVVAGLLVVCLGPFLEELVFRGFIASYLFPDLTTKKQMGLYLVFSSTLFSLVHLPNSLVFFLLYFLMGVVLGWLYLAKRDIRYSIALHVLNNLLGFVSILLSMQ